MRVRVLQILNPPPLPLHHISNYELNLFFLAYMMLTVLWYGMVCCLWAELGYRS
jgi:hypothetical protein